MKAIGKFFDSIFNSGVVQSFKMAIKSILSNKLRSFLTMLGIIIGVVALVVLVSLVNGGTSTITGTIQDMGNDLVAVYCWDDRYPIHIEDLDGWEEDPAIEGVAPYSTASGVAKYRDEFNASCEMRGVTSSYFSVMDMKILVGRYLTNADYDNRSNVCVLNEKGAKTFVGYLDCVGDVIFYNGTQYTIVGVLDDNEDSLESLWSNDVILYVPFSTMLKTVDNQSSNINQFYVGHPENEPVANTTAAVKKHMEELIDDPDAYTVQDQTEVEDVMGKVTTVLSVILGAIAGISLFVGGIGIMNIMLVTVTERTKEIGIRKAIGASRGVILRQFLFEAVVICLMGCGIGIFVSWVLLKIGSVITASLGLVFDMNSTVVIIAVVFCFLIGIIFGLYPANKAAKMKPIDALHYGG